MEDELQIITTRLPKKVIEYVEKVAKEEHLDKASLYRKFLYLAIEEDKLNRAIEKFKQNTISLLTAAQEAEIPITIFIDKLIKANVHWGIGIEEYRDGKKNLSNIN
jgi:predicted HTH domain antitoxin